MSSPAAVTKHDDEKQQFENITDKSPSEAEVESFRLNLRGKRLTAALAFVAGTGFTLFGWVLYHFGIIYSVDHVDS